MALKSGCSTDSKIVPSAACGRDIRAKADGDEILPHQAGEFDGRLAVGLDQRALVQSHHDIDLVAGEFDVINAADLHAGHLDAVAHFQVLHGVKLRADVVAVAEKITAAERFNDRPGGQHHEDDK